MRDYEFQGEDRLPDCIFLKLHGENSQPVNQNSLPFFKKKPPPIELKVTLRFGHQSREVFGGVIIFSLRRGRLDIKLVNGKMPVNKMRLVAGLETSMSIEVKKENNQEEGAGIVIGVGVGVPKASVDLKHKAIVRNNAQFTYKGYIFENKGREENPAWVFSDELMSDPGIVGQLTEESLGIIEKEDDSKPIEVEALFTVPFHRDLWLTAQNLWVKEISKEKSALIEREFFLRFLKPMLEPYLSKVKGEL